MKPLTLQEAKKQVARQYGYRSVTEAMSNPQMRDEAAQLYGDSQYNQAIEEVILFLTMVSAPERYKLLEELKRLKR